ncbi:hypothetical protein [Sulfuriflexus mobilis]|uniref:hypothetical protein n=1 Tax=Sulfuriflexus mobilis TaxID=1811807 RepID=UPI000F832D6E|nr:hypothetical protein [Sulfuriflexus mobilis]
MINIIKNIKTLVITGVMLFASSVNAVYAEDVNWHAESENYHVYFGVVPASMIKNTTALVDNDKQLHGGLDKLSSVAQHVMISVYRKDGKTRVNDATVIAEVSSGILLWRKELEKPLEKMTTSGQITYANFFDMKEKGKYKIEVEIYESQKNGSDELAFFYSKE